VGSIIFVGLVMVFSIFLILYGVFNFMGYVFTERTRRKVRAGPTVKVIEEGEEDEIAAISAALMLVLERGFEIKSVRKKLERGFVIWRKTGWKGVGGWRGSSKWS